MAEDFTFSSNSYLVDPTSNLQDEDEEEDVSSFISTSSEEDSAAVTPQVSFETDHHHHQHQHQQETDHHHHHIGSSVGDEQVALSILTDLPTHSSLPSMVIVDNNTSPQSNKQLSSHHHHAVEELKPQTTLATSTTTTGLSSNNSRGSSSAVSSAAMMRGGTQFLLQQQGGTASIDSSFLQPFSNTIIPPPSIATSINGSSASGVVVSNNNTLTTIPSIVSTTSKSSLPNKVTTNSTPPNDPTQNIQSIVTPVKTSPPQCSTLNTRKRVSSNSSSNQSIPPPQKSSSRSAPSQQPHQHQQHTYDSETSDTIPLPSNAYSYPNMLHSPAMAGHGMIQPFYLNGMSHDQSFLYSQPDMHWYSHYPNQLWGYYSYPTQPGIPTNNEEEPLQSLEQENYPGNAVTETDTTQQTVEGTIYVNPKQYQRILKRRIARAKLEQQMKNAGQYKDKSYKYNSRHEWAKKRARGPGGRFLSKKEKQELEEREKGEGSTVEPPTQPPPKQKQAKKKSKTDTNTQSGGGGATSSLPQPFLNQSFYASIPPNGPVNYPSEFLSLPTHQHNYKSM